MILLKEANLFCDWYAKKKLSKIDRDKFTIGFKKIVKRLTTKLKLKDNVFVHRDFHVSNLMLVKNQIGVIDSQDALIGNRAYDLASLVDDVRLKTSKTFKDKIYKLYMTKNRKLDKNKFKNDFEILSILRNLKIIGIFTRLAIRDGKKEYLKLIPYAWTLINSRINKNKIFFDLKNLLNKNFEKFNEN
jgi:aminoglycoside/choline kinase family phosphotransferase